MKILVVIPSEKLEVYEEKGLDDLEDYYNPNGYFQKVYVLSPIETVKQYKYGMEIIPISSINHYRETIIKISPSVVRSYGGYWASKYACLYTPKHYPVVCSLHDSSPRMIFRSLKYASYIFYTSDIVKQTFLNKVNYKGKHSLLPNRVDFSKAKILQTVQPIDNKLKRNSFFLHVGRKSIEKNLPTVLKAFSLLDSDSKLVIIGAGPDKEYRQVAEALGIYDKCIWIYSIPSSELYWYYSNAIALVNPSLWEGFGKIFIEAAAVECPIITSNIAPMNDIFTKDAVLFTRDVADHVSLVDDMDRAYDLNYEERALLTSEAYRCASKFSKDDVNDLEISLYKRIISDKKERETPNSIYCFLYNIIDESEYFFQRVKRKIKILNSKHLGVKYDKY